MVGAAVAPVPEAPTTSSGGCTVPVSAAAATMAMDSGDITTRPCPIEVAPRSALSVGRGTEPAKESSPMSVLWPTPSMAAAAGRSGAARWPVASWMNAVLHDSVNACSSVLTGASPSALWNTSPSTVAVPGQLAADFGDSPWVISAVEVITLNVEPGGKSPVEGLVEAGGVDRDGGQDVSVGGVHRDQRGALLLPGQRRLGGVLHRPGRSWW